ncbi:hypothetical protein F0562_031713 [Nyssa sinensis]|uniref:non-specific serine/threonine protein kinase n=1 Tax=Nyssa sinensis TaxID=561372 RepID=A0A5J5AUX5_9ASTE|nr:hypothetical protein F0562_031713 [Nyssa sinensis]
MIFVLYLLVSISTTAKAAAQFSHETDRLALLAFKDLMKEGLHGSLISWNETVPLCNWHGVTCGRRHQRVVALDLQSQGLAGSISPSIGNLTFLRSIYLQDNLLQGSIPQELGRLSRLQHLNFTNNTIQGDIPATLANCSDLRLVDLMFNDLVGKIPALFGSLSKLTFLGLHADNLIGGIPPSLSNLTLLQRLSLGSNSLTGIIPDSTGRLTNLQFFGMGQNKLSGSVPPSLFNISSLSLSHIFIPANRLTGSIPQNIGLTLPNLQRISVGGNHFEGPFPVSFSNASRMRVLDISQNEFLGPVPVDLGRRMKDLYKLNLDLNNLGNGDAVDLSFLDSLTNCTRLQQLGLSTNGFGGVLPNSISNFSTQLQVLAAGENKFVGTIPAGISNFVNLVALGLEFNYLSGTIPFEIGKLSSLQVLFFSGNALSGLVPSSIGNLTQIFELHLDENNLTGSIPSSVEKILSLQIFNIAYNSFVGSIPNTIGLFPALSIVNLAHNFFMGTLPVEIGSLKDLQELDVSENKLSGGIPSTLSNCLRLESLHLAGNLFAGRIPPSFSSLKAIVDFDLSRNKLSGQIPVDLQTLTFLKNLNLSFNYLEGEVPSEGVFRNTSIISLNGNMKLCGGVRELHLPICPFKESTKKSSNTFLKIVVPIASVVVCLALATIWVVSYRKRKPRKRSPSRSPLGDALLRVSYDQLLKATDGFASTNLIGVGSFGTVYKGILHQDEKVVAVKVLNLEQLGASKSFIAECEALRNTRHRNLLKIITTCSSVNFEGNDFKALVFEFMSNGSLESWLHPYKEQSQARNLNLTQRLNVALDVASALDYLHHRCQTAIVHCDLKPSNVLLDEDMTAHVGDFGLARLLTMHCSDTAGGQTNSIAIKGSVGYVAPEYGMGGEVSTQGDVYSYGILLLEMLTGKRPTSEMFTDGLSLHKFSKMVLPERVMEIVDPRLQLEESSEATRNTEIQIVLKAKAKECLISLVRIGVACSSESPSERMNIKDVVTELSSIKEVFLGVKIRGQRQTWRQLAVEGTSRVGY